MSFYSDASLVMIPSGYKTSKVYSAVPTDGAGDLSFTRTADTATRVGPDGLIEKVRTNLILQSETFDNASWTKSNATITANSIANPLNGAVNADTITLTGATTQKYIAQSFVFSGNYTTSVYLKAGTHQFVQLMLGTDPTPFANFDLVNGTASATGSTATIVSAGSGWYRCSMSFTSVIGTTVFITAADSLATPRFQPTASTGTYIAFGYQLETGDIATPYIATTSAAVSVGPVANVPRLDYLNSSCPRLLLEPQRSSLINFSEQIDNAWWTKVNLSITANQAVSPDGYTNADLITLSAGLSVKQFYSTPFTPYTSNYAYSGFFKKGTHNFIQLLAGPTDIVNFDLTLGTYNSPSATSGKIENYGNGWYRCTMLASGAVAAISIVNVLAVDSLTSARGQSTSSTGTFYAWGMQIEAGADATSYIPTLGAAVTRGAENSSKSSITSLIGQTEGTIYAEIVRTQSTAGDTFWIGLSDNSVNNWIFIGTEATGGRAYVRASNVVAFDQYPAISVGTHKMAIAYKSGSIAVYLDGVQMFTSSATFTIGSLTGVSLGPSTFTLTNGVDTAGAVKQSLLFKTRLTNAQLAELTTI